MYMGGVWCLFLCLVGALTGRMVYLNAQYRPSVVGTSDPTDEEFDELVAGLETPDESCSLLFQFENLDPIKHTYVPVPVRARHAPTHTLTLPLSLPTPQAGLRGGPVQEGLPRLPRVRHGLLLGQRWLLHLVPPPGGMCTAARSRLVGR